MNLGPVLAFACKELESSNVSTEFNCYWEKIIPFVLHWSTQLHG